MGILETLADLNHELGLSQNGNGTNGSSGHPDVVKAVISTLGFRPVSTYRGEDLDMAILHNFRIAALTERAQQVRQRVGEFAQTLRQQAELRGATPVLIAAPSSRDVWGRALEETTTVARLDPDTLEYVSRTRRKRGVLVDERTSAKASVSFQTLALRASAVVMPGNVFLGGTGDPEEVLEVPLYESAIADGGKGLHAPNDFAFHDTGHDYLSGARIHVGWMGLRAALSELGRRPDGEKRTLHITGMLEQIGLEPDLAF